MAVLGLVGQIANRQDHVLSKKSRLYVHLYSSHVITPIYYDADTISSIYAYQVVPHCTHHNRLSIMDFRTMQPTYLDYDPIQQLLAVGSRNGKVLLYPVTVTVVQACNYLSVNFIPNIAKLLITT